MLDHPSELTINATAFKARCLELMDQLAARKLTRIIITKRGKPVSVMEAPAPPEPKKSIIGCMADVMPKLTDEEWKEVEREIADMRDHWPDVDAMERSLVEQMGRHR